MCYLRFLGEGVAGGGELLNGIAILQDEQLT